MVNSSHAQRLKRILLFILGRLWTTTLLSSVGAFILYGTFAYRHRNGLYFVAGLVLGGIFAFGPFWFIAKDIYYAITWRKYPKASEDWFKEFWCYLPEENREARSKSPSQ